MSGLIRFLPLLIFYLPRVRCNMKIYGRSESSDMEFDTLTDVSLVAEPNSLRELASFLYQCADAIEEQGDSWENDKFECNDAVCPDLVVYNPNFDND